MNLEDTYFNWGLKHFKFRDLRRDFNVTGRGVKVLVIDSGRKDNTGDSIDLCTPIGDAMLMAFRKIGDKADDNDRIKLFEGFENPPRVTSDATEDLHGSEVCAIIGANSMGDGREGVAPGCEILVANVFDGEHQKHELIPLAIYWGLFKGVDIINISQQVVLCNDKLNRAILAAYRKNIPVICGTGNTDGDNGDHMSIAYPAAFQTTFGIGAMNELLMPASGMDQGQLLCFLAPGEGLESYFFDEKPIRGTSFATPFVTGIIALLFQKLTDEGKIRPRVPELKRLLIENTDQRDRFDIRTGFGIIDPRKLLENWRGKIIVSNDPFLSSMVRHYLQFKMNQGALIHEGLDLERQHIVIEI